MYRRVPKRGNLNEIKVNEISQGKREAERVLKLTEIKQIANQHKCLAKF